LERQGFKKGGLVKSKAKREGGGHYKAAVLTFKKWGVKSPNGFGGLFQKGTYQRKDFLTEPQNPNVKGRGRSLRGKD